MGLIIKYSSEQRFVSLSENVSDRGNAISKVSVAFAASHTYPQAYIYITFSHSHTSNSAFTAQTLNTLRFSLPNTISSVITSKILW